MTTYLSRLEAQAEAEADRRYDDTEPAPIADSIQAARDMIAMLGDTPDLLELQVLEAGACEECDTGVQTRYQLGVFALCRTCTLRRLHARTLAGRPVVRPALQLETLEPPANLTRWAKDAGRCISDHAVKEHLDVWDVHGEQREKLLKVSRHVRDGLAARVAA